MRAILECLDCTASACASFRSSRNPAAIRDAVKDLPPEIGCEIIESGIHLTGGGACLPGMADLIAAETRVDVHPAKNPLRAVINGARQMLVTGAQTDIWAVS